MSLVHTLRKLKRRVRAMAEAPYVPGKHPDDRLGWIMTPELLEMQTSEVHRMIGDLKREVPFEEVLKGFDGRLFGERIVEYPYFADWFRRIGEPSTLLDIGCVLNNPAISGFLSKRVSSLWFCNPAVEPLVHEAPTYYHVSKLSEAFPGGERFPAITCLSTIEHIGYDNSQYGSMDASDFTSPSDQPLLDSLEKIVGLLKPGGSCLLSVPFGCRAVNIHRVTKKPAFQSFDWKSAKAVLQRSEALGVETKCAVYAGDNAGWHALEDPASFQEPYGNGFPGASAVLLIESTKP